MIKRYSYGDPLDTEAVLNKPAISKGEINYLWRKDNTFSCSLDSKDIVYGLGENVRGINKRGHKYISYCTDDPLHTEDKNSLYGAHNFILISRPGFNIGIFVDTASTVTFDIGYSKYDELSIIIDSPNYEIYIITGSDTIKDSTPDMVTEEFRKLIGPSYIAPEWAFGYAQSRWGYRSSDDIREVYNGYHDNDLPLDMIYVDIDYMERYKDFTINREAFPDFENLVLEMKDKGVRLIPIIDGAVKIEDGYDVYEEGRDNNYFCKDANGEDFVVGVWPGDSLYPDYLNDDARAWFSDKYKFLLDMGIEGFWNDMNEPAIFYSRKHLSQVFNQINEYKDINLDLNTFFEFKDLVNNINNNPEDYKSFYHNYKGHTYCHSDVHNLYGYYMTRGASEAFKRICPDKDILIISRASYIGMHRYAGIWQGDNCSYWSHLLMNLKMMPSLNMCGFLYTGADMGGFGANTTEDLLLRWTALAIFMPLMRNHSALGTRQQEFYQFPDSIDLFRNLLNARKVIAPYLYRIYLDACQNGKMMFRPLGFRYENDDIAREIEDQLLIGDEYMIAPIVSQNVSGRIIYFPEDMQEIRFEGCQIVKDKEYKKGHHYVDIPLGVATVYKIKK